MTAPDVVDRVVGVTAGDPIDTLRRQRPADARANAQASHEALFAPASPGDVSLVERHAIAYWTAALSSADAVAAVHREALAADAPGILAAIDAALPAAVTSGPYGAYPVGPLSDEDEDGLHWAAPVELRDAVGDRIAAALEHAHLLTYRPRDSSPEALEALLAAGWTTTGIVTISQAIAFVSFQLRVATGLSVLKSAAPTSTATTDTAPKEES